MAHIATTICVLLAVSADLIKSSLITRKCPSVCRCQFNPVVIVTCANASLMDVPRNLPVIMETLDLSGNRLTVLSQHAFSTTVSIETLDLARNRISSIETGSFANLTKLKSIDLNDNLLSSIDGRTFGVSMGSLVDLTIAQNRLTDIDGAFDSMHNLSKLDLRNNMITALTEFTFRDLVNLRQLYLSGNRIYTIEKGTFRRTSRLFQIYLKGNPLHEITGFHFSMPSKISYIDLSECGLTHVPRGLPSSLKYLQLRRNNLTALSADAFADCGEVEILLLEENRIETIADGTFSNLRHLQRLWLNENRLRQLPRPLPASLRRLLADNNDIKQIDSNLFTARCELSALSLTGNLIDRISAEAFDLMTSLQSLDLSSNQIERIDSSTFRANHNLTALSLSNNPLVQLQSDLFANLHSLKDLSLGYITSEALDIGGSLLKPLVKLQRLDVDNSPQLVGKLIDQLTAELLPSLKELFAGNSELATLPERCQELFSQLSQLKLSSAQWRCDRSLRWFAEWLKVPTNYDKIVDQSVEYRCEYPPSVRGSQLVDVSDWSHDDQATTAYNTLRSTSNAVLSLPTEETVTDTDYDDEDDYEDDMVDENLAKDNDFVMPLEPPNKEVKLSSSMTPGIVADEGKTAVDEVLEKPAVSDASATHSDSEEQLRRFKLQLIIAVTTVGATIVAIAAIVTAIVYVCKCQQQRRRPSANATTTAAAAGDTTAAHCNSSRTFIKYKNKNGVLYFSTPAADNDTPSVHVSHLATVEKGSANLVHYVPNSCNTPVVTPGTPGSLKTRVYRWEDF